jgi:hypothetical protein
MKLLQNLLTVFIVLVGFCSDVAQAQCSPTLKEIYDFEVGDQFFYRETTKQYDPREHITYAYHDFKIIDKYVSGDTLQYIRLSNKNIRDTLFFVDSANHPLNRCNNQIDTVMVTTCSRHQRPKFRMVYALKDVNKHRYKLFGSEEPTNFYSPDSLGYFNFEMDEFKGYSHECYSIYREGLGLFCEGSYIFETNHYIELQSRIRGSDTLMIALTNRNQVPKDKINVYPNPTSSFWNIESPIDIEKIDVFDLTGHKMKPIITKRVDDIRNNTLFLSPGVYIVYLKTSHGYFTRKLIKL